MSATLAASAGANIVAGSASAALKLAEGALNRQASVCFDFYLKGFYLISKFENWAVAPSTC